MKPVEQVAKRQQTCASGAYNDRGQCEAGGPPGNPLSSGAIAGIAVGGVAGVLIVAGLAWFLWRRRRRQSVPARATSSPPSAYMVSKPELDGQHGIQQPYGSYGYAVGHQQQLYERPVGELPNSNMVIEMHNNSMVPELYDPRTVTELPNNGIISELPHHPGMAHNPAWQGQ